MVWSATEDTAQRRLATGSRGCSSGISLSLREPNAVAVDEAGESNVEPDGSAASGDGAAREEDCDTLTDMEGCVRGSARSSAAWAIAAAGVIGSAVGVA